MRRSCRPHRVGPSTSPPSGEVSRSARPPTHVAGGPRAAAAGASRVLTSALNTVVYTSVLLHAVGPLHAAMTMRCCPIGAL